MRRFPCGEAARPVFPQPSLFMAVTVAKKGDEGKISSALARLMEEDPTLSYQNNAETHQQVIGGRASSTWTWSRPS